MGNFPEQKEVALIFAHIGAGSQRTWVIAYELKVEYFQ
jgi:hypothetical protein